ncbi:DUF3149 domain-containing protein [Alteromonas oceanisediminis]|nr:DUF3149 domain-containing protein [Alteromonas oceanisediminis]MBT0584828.1 DUF3149 domain-containing protein [Alteromonas oceanisediminis]
MPLNLFFDPVVWMSLMMIAIIIGMCGYFTYMFIHNSADHSK